MDDSMTHLRESVRLFEGEDGGDRADDHHEDGEEEHGVQDPVLATDARHPPVANLGLYFGNKFFSGTFFMLTTNFLCLIY